MKNKPTYLCEAIILLTRWAVPALAMPESYFGVLVAKPTVYFKRKIWSENKNLACNFHTMVPNKRQFRIGAEITDKQCTYLNYL